MVVFLRSLDCQPDPRVQKYCDFLKAKEIPYCIYCWDRNLKYSDDNEHIYFHRKAEYGTGMKNWLGIILFNFFLVKQLFLNRKSYQTIHACDFDTVLSALFIKLFYRKKLVYDVFDWFVDSRNFDSGLIRSVILSLEHIALKHANVVIICDEEREKQLNYVPKHLWVLPNIPNFSVDLNVQGTNEMIPREVEVLHLSYVGTMPTDRGLDKLLECVKNNPKLYLDIAGFGSLDKMVKEYSDQCSNINFHGMVSYEEGMKIMSKSDIIVALYEKKIRNNIYAAPNKYYEGLYLRKPILTTKGTLVGNHTEKYATGFVIGEELEDLVGFFQRDDLREKISAYGENASRLWNEKYCRYVENFMSKIYLSIL